jgi:hypothetical protein
MARRDRRPARLPVSLRSSQTLPPPGEEAKACPCLHRTPVTPVPVYGTRRAPKPRRTSPPLQPGDEDGRGGARGRKGRKQRGDGDGDEEMEEVRRWGRGRDGEEALNCSCGKGVL